jgi:general secretion pathway protein K
MKGGNGTILVTTLWILALLTLLALGIGVRIGIDVKLMSFFLNSSKAHYLAEAGLRKTVAMLEKDGNKRVDSLNEVWSCGFDFDSEEYVLKEIALGDGNFTVSYELGEDQDGNPIYLYGASDEEGKLNINKIDNTILLRLPNFSSEIVAAILDWRDEDSLTRSEGVEDDYYEELDNPYECKDAQFSIPEELLLVKGITAEVYDGVRDIITVYGDDKAVNINTAPEDVLAILIGTEFEALPGKIVRYRNGADELPGTKDDRIFTDTKTIVAQLADPLAGGLNLLEQKHLNSLIQKKYFKVYSNTFRVISQGQLGGGRVRKTIEAVVKRDENGSQILYYYED